jgi:plastocyanin
MKTASTNIGFAILTATVLVSSGCGSKPASEAASGTTSAASHAAANAAGAAAAPAPAPAPKRPATSRKIVAPPDAAVITGRILYQGTPPKPKVVNLGAEKVCSDLHHGKPPVYENLVVNPDGTVKWALVAVRGNVTGAYPPPKEPIVVDQVGCVFTPHVVAAQVGQEIEYRNSDPVTHNIRATATRNRPFNQNFAPKTDTRSKLDTAEVGIPLKCDIHYWMSGYIHVFPHPFFAITGDDGSYVISGVPPGSYTLLVWHETLKTQTQLITLSAGEVKELDFSFAAQ